MRRSINRFNNPATVRSASSESRPRNSEQHQARRNTSDMPLPTGKQWVIEPQKGFDGLVLQSSVPTPEPEGTACVVRLEAASLNYRDIAMAMGNYPSALKERFIPISDGAGTVIATGPS